MVIVRLSDNQRRVISAEKGETVSQLCRRFCNEYSYPVANFEFQSISTNQPLPPNLMVNDIKEVRLIQKSNTRKDSQDSCYSSIDEKCSEEIIRQKIKMAPARPPPISKSAIQIDKKPKRSAPRPPVISSEVPSSDLCTEEAEVSIPDPPPYPTAAKRNSLSKLFMKSVECGEDSAISPQLLEHSEEQNFNLSDTPQLLICSKDPDNSLTSQSELCFDERGQKVSPSLFTGVVESCHDIYSPRICHPQSYHSSSVDSSEDATSLEDIEEITNLSIKDTEVHKPLYVCPKIDSESEEIFKKEDVSKDFTEIKFNDEENNYNYEKECQPCSPVQMEEINPSSEEESSPIILTLSHKKEECLSISPMIDVVDFVHKAEIQPVKDTTIDDPVVITTVPISSNKKFWEPVKCSKQLFFTSRKEPPNDIVKTNNSFTATTLSASALTPTPIITPISTPGSSINSTFTSPSTSSMSNTNSPSSSKPNSTTKVITTEVEVKEREYQTSERPDFRPLRPKSLFFSAGNK